LKRELDECEAEEIDGDKKEEPDIDWESFKADVGFKHMILEMDLAIVSRTALIKTENHYQ
jgi:hypothetical protein